MAPVEAQHALAWFPLALAIEQVRVGCRLSSPWLQRGVSTGPVGWVKAAELSHDPVAVTVRGDLLCALLDTRDRRIDGIFLLLQYCWPVMAGAVACFLISGRVSQLRVERVAVQLPVGIAFRDPQCWGCAENGGPVAGASSLRQLRCTLVLPLVGNTLSR